VQTRHPLLGTLIVVLAASLFGTLGLASRAAYAAGLVPLTFMVWRAATGAVGIAAYICVRPGGARSALASVTAAGSRARLGLGVASVSSFTLNLAIFWAFDRITIAVALLCFYTYPAMVAAVEVLTGREPLDRTRGLALALGLGGMVAVVAGGLGEGSELTLDPLGIVAALSAAVSQTVFVLVSRETYRSVATEAAMAVILAGSVLLGGLVAIAGGLVGNLVSPLAGGAAGSVLPVLLYAGLVGAALPSALFLTGIRWIGGTRTGVLMLFEPVVGVVLAALFLSEPVLPVQGLGGIAILGAAILLHRVPVREP
jgi:DME family drug/metabolite transporter